MGVDVSHHQGTIHWRQVNEAGNGFAFTKATQGTTFVDPCLEANIKGCQDAGIIPGCYHFYLSQAAPLAQADFFFSMAQSKGFPFDEGLPLCLDTEDRAGAKAIGYSRLRANTHVFLERLTALTGRKPLIYCDPNFGTAILGPGFGAYPLWIASLNATPHIPPGWAVSGWKFWQWNWVGRVAGIAGDVDLDRWNGDLDTLKAWVKSAE